MEIDTVVQQLLQKPRDDLDNSQLDVIHARRKQLADVFFNQSATVEQKLEVYDELNSIHKFLNMKQLFKPKKAKRAGGTTPQKPLRT
jgi:hypothetical protein